MKHTLTSKAAELMRKNGKHRRWRRAFSGMAAVVVFITTYMLILPAITMENQAICGMAEHTHTDACYEMQLVCTQEETPEGTDVHVHGPECYEQQQVLTCTKQEGEGHAHSDACYGYVCGQEESTGHTHTDACYTEVTHRELTCTEPESAGHSHGEGCYDADGNLVCTEAESTGHTHGDSCYTETVTRELTCGQEESAGHTHTDACIGLICGKEEYEGHTHTDACYTTEDVLVCTEPTGHTHGDGCYEKVLVCDVPEHTHTEECYPAAEPEEPQEPELICTIPEHSHEDACYDADGNLICGLEEHTHTEECYAPVEIPEEETPTTAFPEEIPEGYVEYTFDNEAGLTVTAYAPEGAFGQDVQLFAEVLSEDSEEYAQAKENLDKAENAPEYTGMAAMDIRFVDAAAEDPAAAEEIEPDAEMGQVFVKIDAKALLPEDVDESTLAVQHHAKVSDGGIFGTGILEHTDVVVETVADISEETGDITATPGETALPETLPALADEPEMAEAATLEEPAAETETEETQPAAMNVEAEFAVNSFSMFTITWDNMYGTDGSLKVRYYLNSAGGTEIGGTQLANVTISDSNGWISLKDYIGEINEYEFSKIQVRGSSYESSWSKSEYTAEAVIKYSYKGSHQKWVDNKRVTVNDYYWLIKTSSSAADRTADTFCYSDNQGAGLAIIYTGDQKLETIENPLKTAESITINLYDYVSEQVNYDRHYARPFLFNDGGGTGINDWTESSAPRQNIVKSQLTPNDDGTYQHPVLTNNYSNNYSLSYLFNDSTPGVTAYEGVDGLFQKDSAGYYYYDATQNFAKLNGSMFTLYNQQGKLVNTGSAQQNVLFMPFNAPDESSVSKYNYHFGMTIDFEFIMPEDGKVNGEEMIFTFTGDDDVWVFIDGQLVLDLGGIHDAATGTVNFATGKVTVNGQSQSVNGFDPTSWETYSPHSFKFYYFERGKGASNCAIRFNLPTVPKNSLIVGKELTGDNSGNEASGDVLEFVSNSLSYTFEVLKTDSDGTILTDQNGKPISMIEDGGYPMVNADMQKIGEVTVDGGRFTLKAGQYAQFADVLNANAGSYIVRELLPENSEGIYNGVQYTVGAGQGTATNEEHVENFDGYKTGVQNAEAESTRILFTNQVKVDSLAILNIAKELAPGSEISEDTDFTIQVKTGTSANSLEPLPVDTIYYVDGKQQKVTTAGEIKLRGGQNAQLGVIAGTYFSVTETNAQDYTVTYDGQITSSGGAEDGTVTVDREKGVVTGALLKPNATASVTVTNADYDFAAIVPLSKTLLGAAATEEHTFKFQVKQVQKGGDSWIPVEPLPGTSITTTGESGGVDLYIGFKSTVNLGEYYYKVSEVIPDETGGISYDESYYIVKVTVSDSGTGKTARVTDVTKYSKSGSPETFPWSSGTALPFTNSLTGSLSITKDVKYNGSDTYKSTAVFAFEVKLNVSDYTGTPTVTYTKDGNVLAWGAVKDYTGWPDGTNVLPTTANFSAGKATVYVPAGATIQISGLPAAATATITETEASRAGYAVTWTGTEGSIDGNGVNTSVTTTQISNHPSVTCTNTTGAVLPSTGGMGTTPFLALGTLLTLGAGMLLVQRRRKEGSDAV